MHPALLVAYVDKTGNEGVALQVRERGELPSGHMCTSHFCRPFLSTVSDIHSFSALQSSYQSPSSSVVDDDNDTL